VGVRRPDISNAFCGHLADRRSDYSLIGFLSYLVSNETSGGDDECSLRFAEERCEREDSCLANAGGQADQRWISADAKVGSDRVQRAELRASQATYPIDGKWIL
jgi:hypothetical protein